MVGYLEKVHEYQEGKLQHLESIKSFLRRELQGSWCSLYINYSVLFLVKINRNLLKLNFRKNPVIFFSFFLQNY